MLLLALQLTYYWYLCPFWTSLCNHWTPWFPYLHLRPPCLILSNLTLLSLVLQHSCIHQNSWAPAISNSVFVFWTFRLTLQNLQKLLIFPMSLPSITNSLMFSTKIKLKFLLHIVLMISKSIWKKMLNLWLVSYTFFQHQNKRLLRNSLRKTSIWISSD